MDRAARGNPADLRAASTAGPAATPGTAADHRGVPEQAGRARAGEQPPAAPADIPAGPGVPQLATGRSTAASPVARHLALLIWYLAAPAGIDLGFHSLMPLPGLLMTPITLAFGPSASYNVMVILVPGLLCYAMYRAARLWLRSQPGAIAAGAFFGLSAMLAQEDWYHLNIAVGALFLPLALEASVRLRRRPGIRQAIALGLVLGAAMLTDPESVVMVAMLTALLLLPWLVRQHSLATLRAAALAVVTGALVAAP